MKLYTKSGDDGTTGLFGGARVDKNDPRVAAYGSVDETNAAIGLAVVVCGADSLGQRLREVQAELFVVGAELATPEHTAAELTVGGAHVSKLERWIDEAENDTQPLRRFILPGGSEFAARLHLARTICRRGERDVVTLARTQTVRPDVVHYLNRLGDLLFAWARWANHHAGVADIEWTAPKP